MRIALYGMPCSGKTTIMEKIPNARILHGGQELNRICGGKFASLSNDEKKEVRIKYTEYIRGLTDRFIVSDGHYSFLEDIAFTDSDGELYDAFLYLFCSPETLLQRYRLSSKNSRFAENTVETIEQWQYFEIEHLRAECHKRKKDFYVISDAEKDPTNALVFIELIRNNHSGFRMAYQIYDRIRSLYPQPCELFLVDGDKTAILQDSFRFCCGGKTTVFDGNFYTDYQSYLFTRELSQYNHYTFSNIDRISRNHTVWNEIQNRKNIVLSSGITELWGIIGKRFCINNIIADPMISADTKYYVTKLLQEAGYIIKAYGDSKNDLYMLLQANEGTLFIGEKISRSLYGVSLHGIRLIYDHHFYRLSDTMESDVLRDIQICKSNSGINGNRLASAHMHLGQRLGNVISELLPSQDTAILVLERGGRFFGDGLYIGFGGVFYSIDPSKETIPKIEADRIILVDSVINTGKTILRIAQTIKAQQPNIDIIIAANVIQDQAMKLLEEFKVYSVRTSGNSFIGRNQAKQYGKNGPDTADRLFNLIEKRF